MDTLGSNGLYYGTCALLASNARYGELMTGQPYGRWGIKVQCGWGQRSPFVIITGGMTEQQVVDKLDGLVTRVDLEREHTHAASLRAQVEQERLDAILEADKQAWRKELRLATGGDADTPLRGAFPHLTNARVLACRDRDEVTVDLPSGQQSKAAFLAKLEAFLATCA